MASVVTILRSLMPLRSLSYDEALRIAERQASWLLKLAGISEPPVPEAVIDTLPRLRIERLKRIPVSASTHRSSGRWLIVINAGEPKSRQRYSLFHEFKHIVDDPILGVAYRPLPGLSSLDRAELICDYFAACALMPAPWVRRGWGARGEDISVLARRFRVSRTAMYTRLVHLGLLEPPRRKRRFIRRAQPVRRSVTSEKGRGP